VVVPWIAGTIPGFMGASKTVGLILVLAIVAGYVLMIPAATATFRLLVDNETRGLRFKSPEWRFVWAYIKIMVRTFLFMMLLMIAVMIGAFIVALIIGITVGIFGPPRADIWQWVPIGMAIPMLSLFLGSVCIFARYMLALPGASLGQKTTLGQSARWMKGNILRLGCANFTINLPLFIIQFVPTGLMLRTMSLGPNPGFASIRHFPTSFGFIYPIMTVIGVLNIFPNIALISIAWKKLARPEDGATTEPPPAVSILEP
jgi:hypothetical protein